MDEDKYILWLSRVKGLGSRKILSLLEHFKSAKNVFFASRYDLKEVDGFSDKIIDSILSVNKKEILDEYLGELQNKKINFLTINSHIYPKMLKQIYDPPIVLYYLGSFPDEKLIKVGVIGARKCTEYGLKCSYKISQKLSQNNFVIVSGMARGIDTEAHKGAMVSDGYTIAVLGCGVDVCYPPENRLVMKDILKKGCIISEYPPGTTPYAQNFPARNRIISGLCQGIIVVEASVRSGTLITVTQAMEQGRDVFAIPGNIDSKLSEGTNKLIKEGAIPLLSYKDVLEMYNITTERHIINQININLTNEEKYIYELIDNSPIDIDNLFDRANHIDFQTMQFVLTSLEINGLILKLPGQRYIRA